MKQSTMAVTEFKARCLQLLDHVNERGDEIIITKRGKPIAKVEPVRPRQTLRGRHKGQVKIIGDIVNFSVADDWEAIR